MLDTVSKRLAHVARARERWHLPGPSVTGDSMAGSAARPDAIDTPLPDDNQHAVDGVLPPPTTTEDMIDPMGEAMDRMAKDEVERLKVAKRLF